MSDTHLDPTKIHRLRGKLNQQDDLRPGRGPGSRGLEHMARNRRCQRLSVITLVGATPDAAARVLGLPDRSEEASPFASARGQQFEHYLFDEHCQRLWELYARHGDLSWAQAKEMGEADYLDLEERFDLDQRREETEKILLDRAAGDSTPALLLKPRLAIKAAGQEFAIEPDALFAAPGDRFYRVVEIKSYPDRRGYTSQEKTGGAARQAAVGVVAVRQLLRDSGHGEELVSLQADLIFSNSGSNTPTLNRLPVQGEVFNIEASLLDSVQILSEAIDSLGEQSLDDPRAVQALRPHLCSSCSSHCALFEHCRTDAIEIQAPVVLGDSAQELLSVVPDLTAALALRDGQIEPQDADQRAVAELLAAAQQAYVQAFEQAPVQVRFEDEGEGDDELQGLLYAEENQAAAQEVDET